MNDYRNQSPFNMGNTILNLVFFVIVVVGLIWLAGQVYKLLLLLSPAFLIAAAIIDYRVIIGYGRTLWNWLRYRTLLGIVAVLFTIIGYPIVFAYLLVRAILSRKVRKAKKQQEYRKVGEYIEYEEVDEEEVFELPDFKEREKYKEE